MRVLFTNNSLNHRAGTELYVLDVARSLRRQGHEVVAYSTRLGDELVGEFAAAEVPVIADLSQLPFRPDVIHGQHHMETMSALLCVPDVPAVYFCHGAIPWQEAPPVFPRILQYVAIDKACRQRLRDDGRIPDDRIRVLLNFVDLQRFQPRPPLPPRPRRALVFSNYAGPHSHLPIVREACSRHGIEVDVAGSRSGRISRAPEQLLPHYDLVFAKARAALEAMVVGAAVIVCDRRGAGPMVSPANFADLRPWNFGLRTLRMKITPEHLAEQIALYDPGQAAAVSRLARAEAGLDRVVPRIVELYEAVIAEQRDREPDPGAEAQAAGAYLQWLTAMVKDLRKAPPAKRPRTPPSPGPDKNSN